MTASMYDGARSSGVPAPRLGTLARMSAAPAPSEDYKVFRWGFFGNGPMSFYRDGFITEYLFQVLYFLCFAAPEIRSNPRWRE